ncbi:MAG: YdcF family protein [Bryobacteraceae bacterium]
MFARLTRLFRTLLIATGLLVLLVTVAPPRWYARMLAGEWNDPQGPVLVVLGADFVGDDVIGESSYWRSVYALRIWREGGVRKIIVSGNAAITRPMQTFLEAEGIPKGVVFLETGSHSTRENALFTAEVLKKVPGPYVLLTSDYHMWRASRAFAKAGVEMRPRPFPDAIKRFSDWRHRWGVFLELVEETVKIVYYAARSWI